MVPQNQKRRLILFAALLLAALPLSAQSSGQTDSLVRLLNARYIEQVETEGRMARKAIDATFLHNGTYLSCDTALWHVEEKLINCVGHVQLLQGESVLTSGKLDYLIDENLAQFRGGVVELRNRRDNVLRTRILDYNTADSLAVFQGGASMMSADGQIIESDDGTYANARSLFTFTGNVNMFTDSVFVRTNRLTYDSNTSRADFLTDIDFWKDENMLSAGSGWYERSAETFFFRRNVHGLGETQESWSDSLYYYRIPGDVLMLGSVQVQDQSRKVAAMGDRLHYVDSLAQVTLDRRASAALWDGEGAQRDTTYLGATRFTYWTVPKCDISEQESSLAAARREEMLGDPVSEYRRRAAEEAAKAREDAAKNDPLQQGPAAGRKGPGQLPAAANANAGKAETPPGAGPSVPEAPPEPSEDAAAPADSLALPGGKALSDSLAVAMDSTAILNDTKHFPSDSLAAGAGALTSPSDSLALDADALAAAADTLAVPRDSTKMGFLLAVGDIRIFRKDMQVRCDSLRFSDLDSIARLYKSPVVWNEERRQYNSDSLFVLIRNDKMERANLLSNAFIHTEEPGGYYDQIKSTDVIAYFNDSTALRRFDALGGVTALFYLEENGTIATVNKTESRMMMATFDDNGDVDHVYNFDKPKSDAYPVVQLPPAEHKLRGFNWQPDQRPKNKFDVTSMVVKDSEREEYEARPHATFPQTEIYFPGHMKEVYKSLEAARERRNRRDAGPAPGSPADSASLAGSGTGMADQAGHDGTAGLDSLGHPRLDRGSPSDSLGRARLDSLGYSQRDSLGLSGLDSLGHPRLDRGSPSDSLAVRDSTLAGQDGRTQRDTTYMSDREMKRALRIARRDARWAELDQRDADKAAAKAAKKAARKARRAERDAARKARQATIDKAKLEKYIERYQKKKERHEARQQKPVSSGKRPPGAEAGGELPASAESE